MRLARLQEQDVARRRDLPRDRVADGDMGDLLVLGEEDLGRGPDHAVDFDDVYRVVDNGADTRVPNAGRRELKGRDRRSGDGQG